MFIDKRVVDVVKHHITACNSADRSVDEQAAIRCRDHLIQLIGKDQVLVVANGLRRLCDGLK